MPPSKSGRGVDMMEHPMSREFLEHTLSPV